MLKDLLLPHRFKLIGWGLLIGAALLPPLFLAGTQLLDTPWQWSQTISHTRMVIGIIAVCLITFSKEKIDDEYIASLRNQTMTAIFYLFFILSVGWAIANTLHIPGSRRIDLLAALPWYVMNIWIVFTTYIVIFNLRLWLARIRMKNEQ